MKQLKCKSCGGSIEVDESKDFGTCPYCNTKYKLNEDINVNINIDDDIKDMMKTGFSNFGKTSKVATIIICIIAGVMFIGITATMFSSRAEFNKNHEEFQENFDKMKNDSEEKMEEAISSAEISMFNAVLEMYSGTESLFHVKYALDEVVTSNKKNADRLITVVYGDIVTSNPSDIVSLKQSLSDGDYEVSFDYDSVGFINKMSLTYLG